MGPQGQVGPQGPSGPLRPQGPMGPQGPPEVAGRGNPDGPRPLHSMRPPGIAMHLQGPRPPVEGGHRLQGPLGSHRLQGPPQPDGGYRPQLPPRPEGGYRPQRPPRPDGGGMLQSRAMRPSPEVPPQGPQQRAPFAPRNPTVGPPPRQPFPPHSSYQPRMVSPSAQNPPRQSFSPSGMRPTPPCSPFPPRPHPNSHTDFANHVQLVAPAANVKSLQSQDTLQPSLAQDGGVWPTSHM